MAFNNNFTAITGATYTASQYNTHTRDNLTAIWVYTTAGDIAYATGATTLTRLAAPAGLSLMQHNGTVPSYLAKGAANKILRMNSTGTAFEWGSNTDLFGFAASTTVTNSASITGTDISGLTVDISLVTQSTILMWMWSSVNASLGDTPTQAAGIVGDIGGTAQGVDNSVPRSYIQAWNPISNFYYRNGLSGLVTCKVKVFTTDGSRIAQAAGGRFFLLAHAE